MNIIGSLVFSTQRAAEKIFSVASWNMSWSCCAVNTLVWSKTLPITSEIRQNHIVLAIRTERVSSLTLGEAQVWDSISLSYSTFQKSSKWLMDFPLRNSCVSPRKRNKVTCLALHFHCGCCKSSAGQPCSLRNGWAAFFSSGKSQIKWKRTAHWGGTLKWLL